MPARSNDLQRLVFLVKKTLAGTNATVTESKFLTDLQTGDEREVDVCIEADVTGHKVMVCIESHDPKRTVGVEWVERMKGKHSRLPTNTLVLVARSGFSKTARNLARVSGIELLSYANLSEEEVQQAVNLTKRLWAMTVSLSVTKVVGTVPAMGDLAAERIALMPENTCFDASGKAVGSIGQLVSAVVNSHVMLETFRDGTEEHTFFKAEGMPKLQANEARVFIEKKEPRTMRVLDNLIITGTCRIRKARFDLTHGALGSVRVAWGTSVLDGRKAMLVAVKRESGDVSLTLHADKPEEPSDNPAVEESENV